MTRWGGCIGALALLALAAPASAQTTVQLREPTCDRLPFDPDDVRRLLALELSLDDATLSSDAPVVLAYDLEPCVAGATDFALEVTDAQGRARRDVVSMAEVPLAAVPRALALGLAESLRDPEPDPDPTPDPDPDPSHLRTFRLGFLLFGRNTPDTGAAQFGPRLLVELAIADLPLLVRLDLEAYAGPVADFAIGGIGGGVTVAIRAQASDELGLRFGPRIWLGSSSWFDTPDVTLVSEPAVQVGLELRVGLDLRLADGVELLVDAAVGTHIHGLELDRAGQRAGLLGAYWSAGAGLAFY